MVSESTRTTLRPRARLVRTLGFELISSEIVAVIELVKNSYDADASVVLVRFVGPLKEGSGSLEVWDDGHGMSPGTVRDAWLEIATPFRKRARLSEGKKRRVLGEKGIGRLAVGRLGAELELVSRRSEREATLRIDWSSFANDETYLDEVPVDWEVRYPQIFKYDGEASRVLGEYLDVGDDVGHGTLVRMGPLVKTWDINDVAELRRALSRLVPASPDQSLQNVPATADFRIFLELPREFEAYTGEIQSAEELERPRYRLYGTVDADGHASFTYRGLGRESAETIERALLKPSRGKSLVCGPVTLDLRVWDRDADGLGITGRELTDFRKLLDQAAGVSIYRDAFRVMPYGERGNDWLGLDSRRVQNPTLRLSNNQLVGQVFISADTNPNLRDQTNREGIMSGAARDDLRDVVIAAIAVVEPLRFEARPRREALRKASGGLFSRFEMAPVQEAVHRRLPKGDELIEVIDDKARDIGEGVDQVKEELARFSRMATLGTLIDRVIHDARTAVGYINNTTRFALRDLRKPSRSLDEKVEIAEARFNDVARQADVIGLLIRRIEPFGGRRRGRPKVVHLNAAVTDGIVVLDSELRASNTVVEVQGQDLTVTADPAEIQEIVVNLVQNAIYWTSTSPEGVIRKILVDLAQPEPGSVSITVSDSGPGVPVEARELIFEPYYSLRPNGVGLGLSIVGGVVTDYYGGELKLLVNGPLGGASFQAILRRRVG